MHTVNGERGFAYIFLLIAVAIVAGAGANALSQGSASGRRQAEQELLFVGQAFEAALYSYAGQRAPVRLAPGQNDIGLQGPASLEELLRDPRAPQPRRHLRKLYADPVTGGRDWGVIRNNAGRIVGIYSKSESEPIKKAGFPLPLEHFETANSYRDWVFGLPGAKLITSIPKQAIGGAPTDQGAQPPPTSQR